MSEPLFEPDLINFPRRASDPAANQAAIRELLTCAHWKVDPVEGAVLIFSKKAGKWRNYYQAEDHKCTYLEVQFYSATQRRTFYLKRSRIVWLAANPATSIPNDHAVFHVNGNKRDDRIENLRLVTKRFASKAGGYYSALSRSKAPNSI